ncbi:MAG: hypothetical protein MI923_22860 [Phycisphaerales bacterium]|nr:hypothetical protein [Phycisphaerales bacterium]
MEYEIQRCAGAAANAKCNKLGAHYGAPRRGRCATSGGGALREEKDLRPAVDVRTVRGTAQQGAGPVGAVECATGAGDGMQWSA